MKNNIKIAALFAALIGVLIWTSCNKSNTPAPTNNKKGVSQFRDDPDDPPTDCIKFPIDCDFYLVTHISKDIELDPGCMIHVEYDVWTCDDLLGSEYYLFFNHFKADPLKNSCLTRQTHWIDLIIQGKYDEFQDAVEEFLNEAQLAAEYDFYSSYPGVIPPCHDYDYLIHSDFYLNNCWKLYWKIIEIDGIPVIELKYVKCGEGCCKRESNWCKNPDGTLIRTDLGTTKIGDCQGPSDDPPPGFQPVPPPYDRCERSCITNDPPF